MNFFGGNGSLFGVCLVAYLLGSIPFSAWIARSHGVDLGSIGSGNFGATNVARALGKSWGGLALALDASKGYLAVSWALFQGLTGWGPVLAGASSIVGHVFPLFHGFRGGKGVATALGMFLALEPLSTGLAFGVFVVTLVKTRYVSLGSLLAGGTVFFTLLARRGIESPNTLFALLIWSVLLVRHRANLIRLLEGTESKFGERVPTGAHPLPDPEVTP